MPRARRHDSQRGAPERAAEEKRAGPRRAYAWHGVLGALLGIPIAVICATGALASIASDVDRALHPALRVELDAGAPRAPWSALLASAREAAPDARIDSIAAPAEPGLAAQAIARAPDGTMIRLWLDPRDARLRARGPWMTVQRFTRDLHRSLFLGESVGLFLVTSLAFALLASMGTGARVVLSMRRVLRVRRGLDRAPRDLHRVTGIAVLAFALVAGLTGAWYWLELVGSWGDLTAIPAVPSISEAHRASLASGAPHLDIDALVAIGERAYPELEVSAIVLPSARRPTLSLLGSDGSALARDQACQVFLDPYDGSVLGVWRPDRMSALERWAHSADALHFGRFGGLATRALWCVCGIALAALALSGTWIRKRRIAQRRATVTRASPS